MEKEQRREKIQEMVEELTDAELTETDLAHELAELLTEDDVELINDLPVLYRLEIKKVLQERNEDSLATKIET